MENQGNYFIDWKEFLKIVIRDYKKIIILIVIGGIIGIILCGTQNKMFSTTNTNTEALNNAKAVLSKAKIKEVDDSYASYESLVDQRSRLKKFMENSIYLNLDESTAKSNTIVYSVNGNSKVDTIVNGYLSLLKNNHLFSEINNLNKDKYIDSAYLNELINVATTANYNSNLAMLSDATNKTNRSFTITIYGKTDEQCKLISKCVRNEVNIITKKLSKSFGPYSIEGSSDTYEPVISSDITKSRMDYDDKLTSVNNSIIGIRNSLDGDQQTYLNALIDNQNQVAESKVTKKIDIKIVIEYVFLCGLGLAIVYFLIKLIAYIFDNKLHSDKEFLKNIKNVNLITTVNSSKKMDVNVAVEELKYIAQKNNPKEVCLLSTLNNLKEENEIHDDLKKDGVDYRMIPATPETEEDFNTLLTLKKAIIFEKIGTSKYNDLEKMLRYYELKGIDIIGAVLIK